MARYHIGKDGQPHKCKAEAGKCPLGGTHYKTEEEAVAAAERMARPRTTPNLRKIERKAAEAMTIEELSMFMEDEPEPEITDKMVAAACDHEGVLIRLAKDPDENVRYRITRNLYAPKEALEILMKDPIDKIREQACETYELLDDANWSICGYMEQMKNSPDIHDNRPGTPIEGESTIEIQAY